MMFMLNLLACGVSSVGVPVSSTSSVPSAKAITAFSFTSPAATGTVNESAKTIAVTVPYGTNVTSLVATFTKPAVQMGGLTATLSWAPLTLSSPCMIHWGTR
jgi:hypothetical protein